ncbi:MAG: hypothetical protein EBU06_02925 [Micrococcales bacterium]|nr:hypothetical protein [Micrococcales bacterium]NBR61752.1 hypothetical protein [Actinomycetota bacterium]NBT47905.1 hypothetical protein [Actinomycetota bacterium]NBY43445.1 hypothetical protein [Micrococcales bacterium]
MNSSISQMQSTKAISLTFAILGAIAAPILFVTGIVLSGLHGLCVNVKLIYSASQANCSDDSGPALMFGGGLALILSIVLFVYVSKLNKNIDYAIRSQRIAEQER